MARLLDTFQAFSGILVICPCCGELLRVAELSLRYTGKFERTVLDELRQHEKRFEKKQEALDRQLDRFEAKEDALRRAAAERDLRAQAKQLCKRSRDLNIDRKEMAQLLGVSRQSVHTWINEP